MVDAIANIRFFLTSEGGVKRPITPIAEAVVPRVGVYFKFEDAIYGGSVMLQKGKNISPGETVQLPLAFTRPDLLCPLLRIGSKLLITFGQNPIAEAKILQVFDNTSHTVQ
jgi:hypothetical protein